MLIPRCKFVIVLDITSISKLPQSSGHIIVKWHIADSARAETRGHTKRAKVENHTAQFEYRSEFTYNLGISLNKQLRSGTINFEVEWFPVDGKSRILIGSLKLDVAQFVGRDREKMVFLLENSRSNALLTLTLQVQQIKGPNNYEVPPFDAPVVGDQILNMGLEKHGDMNAVLRPLTGKKAYIRYVQHFKQSRSHPPVLSTIADIIKGGDGFCNIPPGQLPQVKSLTEQLAAGDKITKPLSEDEVRDDFISWVAVPNI